MKRAAIVLVLIIILSPGISADHPDGWGIGISGIIGLEGDFGAYGGAVSFKIPQIPIFWNLNAGYFKDTVDHYAIDSIQAGLVADWYFLHKELVPDIGLHWYVGAGVWFNHYTHIFHYDNDENYVAVSEGLGLRVPIGLSFQPVESIEIFLQAVPGIGVNFRFEGKMNDGFVWRRSGVELNHKNSSIELGLRIWLPDNRDKYEEFI